MRVSKGGFSLFLYESALKALTNSGEKGKEMEKQVMHHKDAN